MADNARFNLSLLNVEGTPANEPDCDILFVRTDRTTARAAKHVSFPPDHSFMLPAFPEERNLICQINPSLYQPATSDFFTPSTEITQKVVLVRKADQWTPEFTALDSLPQDRFRPLTSVLQASNQADVKHGPQLGNLADVFDDLRGPQQILAKIALLNLYAVLTDEREPINQTEWFRFVQQIVRIDQERFVAEADPALLVIVRDRILANLDQFKSQGFFTEAAALHLDNIPERYNVTGGPHSVKVRYEQGNLQFTMFEVATAGRNAVLLDCDMDEHSNIIGHTADLFIHAFSGGTHPIEMHEYIKNHNHDVQLGYELAPKQAAEAAAAPVRAATAAARPVVMPSKGVAPKRKTAGTKKKAKRKTG